jgi:hypothetical protein
MSDLHPHRQHGLPSNHITIDPPEPAKHGHLITALLIIAILACIGMAQKWDDYSELETHFVNAQLAAAAERGQAERDWSTKVAMAYEQGQRDAMRVLGGHPQGIEIAQICQAWAHRDDTQPTGVATAPATGPAKRKGA